MVNINDILTLKIIDINNKGNGIAKYNGFVIFVSKVLLNEIVKVRIIKVTNSYAMGEVVEVVEKNQNRIIPKCKYYSNCGGCDFQHCNYSEELNIKNNYLRNIFKDFNETSLFPIISKTELNYRNKITLFVKDFSLGLYEKLSNRVVMIENCLICEDWCKDVIRITNDYLNISKDCNIKGFVFRCLNNKLIVTILSTFKDVKAIEYYYNNLLSVFDTVGISLSVIKDKVMLNYNLVNLIGNNFLSDEIYNLKYSINNASFLQVNNFIKKEIYSYVLDNLQKEDVVIDAYSGAGTLTALISKVAKSVYGIEIVSDATKSANELLIQNNINNVVNINGDCKVELPKLIKEKCLVDFTIILDPPRQGCDKDVIYSILSVKPKKIIYISCNPVTLSRDLGLLCKDYKVVGIQPFDMFPRTANVESVTILENKIKSY